MGEGYSGVGGGPTTALSQIPFFHFTNQKRETFRIWGGEEGKRNKLFPFLSPEKRSQGSPNPAGPAPLLHGLPPCSSQAPLQQWLPRNRRQAVPERPRDRDPGTGTEQLKRKGDRSFPKHSRQPINHRQMTHKAQLNLKGDPGGPTGHE